MALKYLILNQILGKQTPLLIIHVRYTFISLSFHLNKLEIKFWKQNGNHNKSKIKAYTTAFTVREEYNGNEIENLIKNKKNMNPNLQPSNRCEKRKERRNHTHNRRTKARSFFTRPEKFPNPILVFLKSRLIDWCCLEYYKFIIIFVWFIRSLCLYKYFSRREYIYERERFCGERENTRLAHVG